MLLLGGGGGGGARERSVPSDASAARGGGSETVPLGESALTVANAGKASEVRRLRRMEDDDESGGTVRLLARLRPLPMGDGGGRGGGEGVFVSVGCCGCWTSSARKIGQRCTRRRKPCLPPKNNNVECIPLWRGRYTCLDDAETGKSTNVDADIADVVVLHPFEDRRSRSHARVQVKKLRPIRDSPS
jgi:hypothetical protein